MKSRYVILLFGICLLPFVFWLLAFAAKPISSFPEDWAVFANYISGTVGVIITLLGFAIIYLTYTKQIDDSFHSSFESTFFKMIDYQHRIVQNIASNENVPAGFPSLIHLSALFTNHLMIISREIKDDTNHFTRMKEEIQSAYPDAYGRYLHRLGNYFRHLYHIYKYIDESRLPDGQKQRYAKILRAQLSVEEMILIGVDGMTIYGEKFKPIIEKYALLHRLMNFDYYRALFISFYDAKAFGDEDLMESLPSGNVKDLKWYHLAAPKPQ